LYASCTPLFLISRFHAQVNAALVEVVFVWKAAAFRFGTASPLRVHFCSCYGKRSASGVGTTNFRVRGPLVRLQYVVEQHGDDDRIKQAAGKIMDYL